MEVPSREALAATPTGSILEGNAGIALRREGLTWGGLLAGVAYALVLNVVLMFLFVVVRRRISRVYQPRTYLIAERLRVQKPPDGILAWLTPVCTTPDVEIIQKCGVDAFLFIRYIRMMLKIFMPTSLVVIPVLTPINRLSGRGGQASALSVLSISNVAPEHTSGRLWIHLALAMLIVSWVCYVIHEEILVYVETRHKYLNSPEYRRQVSASTLLVANIPEAMLNEETLQATFEIFPGGVKEVMINRKSKEMSSSIAARNKTVEDLEVAEAKMIALCVVSRAKRRVQQGDRTKTDTSNVSLGQLRRREIGCTIGSKMEACPHNPSQPGSQKSSAIAFCKAAESETEQAAWRSHIDPRQRETVRLPIFANGWCPHLPLLGKKVDRIHYLRWRLAHLNSVIESSRMDEDKNATMNSAFIRFNRQIAAHIACQSVMHRDPHSMSPRMLGVDPRDVIWDNLSMGWRQRLVRTLISLLISVSIVMLYAIPVAFTSFLANLDALASRVSWLSWIANWPDRMKSIVQGILPPALLQLLLMLVPTVFRGVSHFQGAPTRNARELKVQAWYFLFLFVQVFIVVSISGGLVGFLSEAADDPKSVPSRLADTLPKAANYFMSYTLVKALTGSGSTLLQTSTLVVYMLSPWRDISPRQKWLRQAKLSNVEWAFLFPPLTNVAVIGIAFSVIAPLVLAFTSFFFALYWLVYRHNVLYVYQYEHDTGGHFFVAAVHQLFAGLYVMELCLVGFFFTAHKPDGQPSCVPHGIIMAIVLTLTAAHQYFLKRTFDPLIRYLPISRDQRSLDASLITSRSRNGISSGASEDVREEENEPSNYTLEYYARAKKPTVWMPRDKLGISGDEMQNARRNTNHLDISDAGASMDEKGRVTLGSCPPELDGEDPASP